MSIQYWLQERLQRGCDWLFSYLPQNIPTRERLESCKIISHRGEHDNKNVYENSIPAFACLVDQGVWGMEFDIRWTKDLVPVVFHDCDCGRLFGSATRLDKVTAQELTTEFPQIPRLAEVIERFGKRLHFMVELKAEHYPDPEYQNSVLQQLFADLEPGKDYHFISLDPEMFRFITFVENDIFLPVAELNAKQMSEIARQRGYGGVTGHYLLLNDRLVAEHQKLGQQVGTGFIASKKCLCRELNRDISWIFTNNALELARIRQNLLAEYNEQNK